MIRGAQKRMIVIRTHDSRVFEEAYFVIRKEKEAVVEDSDMISEADRIIRRNTSGLNAVTASPLASDSRGRLSGKERLTRFVWFCIGALIGSGGTGLLIWLL